VCVCGAWGTLAVGLFAADKGLLFGYGSSQLVIQLIGVAAAFAWAFPVSLVIFVIIRMTVGLRVSEAEELQGLDIVEHGMHAYPPVFAADGFTGSPLAPSPAAPAPAAGPVPIPGNAAIEGT
jgi:Amt family ammonium transporter